MPNSRTFSGCLYVYQPPSLSLPDNLQTHTKLWVLLALSGHCPGQSPVAAISPMNPSYWGGWQNNLCVPSVEAVSGHYIWYMPLE
jgi:hypothetical protein